MLGAIAEAHQRSIPDKVLDRIRKKLSKDLLQVTLEFYTKFGIPEIAEKLTGGD